MDIHYKGRCFFLGLQHVLAMYAGAMIVPLIIGTALNFSVEQLSYLIAADLFTCGCATLLQSWRNRFFGIGLPVVLGCSFTAVFPIITIGKEFGLGAVYGAIICSGIFVYFISGWFAKLVKFFPPVVTGTIITVIGVTLVPVAMNDLAGGMGSPTFGRIENLFLGFIVLIFIILINRFFSGYIQSISVLLGLVGGTILGYFIGIVDFSRVMDASWVNMVVPFYFGYPSFHAEAILTMIIVSMVSMVESTGVFLALGEICNRDLAEHDLAHGYRAEGLAAVLGGIFNSFPYTTFSQNVGLVQLSKVKKRNIIVIAGCILICLGMIPKFAALATLIPSSVLGGAMLAMFGMVISAGIRTLSKVDFQNNGNLLIMACSIAMGLGVTVVPNIFDQLPGLFKIMFGNGIVTGAFTAVVLNIIFNHTGAEESSIISVKNDIKENI